MHLSVNKYSCVGPGPILNKRKEVKKKPLRAKSEGRHIQFYFLLDEEAEAVASDFLPECTTFGK